jgi:Glu-tRNA(Gln) amidotransferase subunit E-like FAD-binding protein
LAGYIVTTGDRQEIERAFDMGEKDIVILVVGQEAEAKEALGLVEEEIAKRNG